MIQRSFVSNYLVQLIQILLHFGKSIWRKPFDAVFLRFEIGILLGSHAKYNQPFIYKSWMGQIEGDLGIFSFTLIDDFIKDIF